MAEKKEPWLTRLTNGLWNNLKSFVSLQKGLGTLAGYARGGLKDLQDVITKPFPDSPQQHDEMGMFGSPTPQMITAELSGQKPDIRTDKIASPKLSTQKGDPAKVVAASKPSPSPEVQAEIDRMKGQGQEQSRGM
jgi:hypothetical protein